MKEGRQTTSQTSLNMSSVRILTWLARYPLQRLDDLEVALAPWHSRSTISRALVGLLTEGLIEMVLPGVAQGKRLYHLSHKGARWMASAETSVEPPPFSTAKDRLIRFLPRLPAALVIQDVVNGLVTGTAAALTRQGRRATLVRWDWQRDVTHAFRASTRRESLTVTLDGVLTLCLHYEMDAATSELSDVWYQLLLLHCPLDDLRLLHHRLDRLLRWRESAERWPVYSQMPPVLLLATTPRQAERWHLASERTAETLHLPPLHGAVACCFAEQSQEMFPWRAAWRTLDANRPCHLQDLLTPHAPTEEPGLALSSPLLQGNVMPVRVPQHPYALARAAARTDALTDEQLAAFHLTPLHWSLVRLLYAHPLLSTAELALFSPAQGDVLEKALAWIQRLGYIEVKKLVEMHGKGRARRRWTLNEQGLHLLAASVNWHVLRLARSAASTGQLQQKGLVGLLNQLPHTLGVYEFFTHLAALPGHVQWWESGMSCARRFFWQRRWYSFQPDACAEYQQDGQAAWRFWLEWDQGTMNVRDLERKFTNYVAYLDAHEWSREHSTLPLLLFVVPEIDQERRVSRCARGLLLDSRLRIFTATRALLHGQGLDAPIWRPVILQAAFSPNESTRVALFADEVSEGSR